MLYYFKDYGGSIKGTVSRVESKDYYIIKDGSEEMIRCSLRGKFKKDFNLKKDKLYRTDIAVVGDYVDFDLNKDGSGIIEKIHPRKNYLSRKAPKIKGSSYRGERLLQVIAANIDSVFIISSAAEPVFNNKVIDRFLVAAESSGLSPAIIINKSDLDSDRQIESWAGLYKLCGYTVYITSVVNKTGFQGLKACLLGKKNLFWGHSGVGKSSILNYLYPGLGLLIGKISSYTEKGTHTTVTTIMEKVQKDTFIIDTPGVREIDPYGIKKEDLGHYFKEFGSYIPLCKFNSCTHDHEPGCAVIEGVQRGKISAERYDSYLRILNTIEEDIIF